MALNIVCLFCNLLHLSDISKCDGSTLDKFVISDSAESLVLHVFLCGNNHLPLTSTFGRRQLAASILALQSSLVL
jgi:hypothetical protein